MYYYVCDLGLCLSNIYYRTLTSRQQHSEDEIHTLVDILSVWWHHSVVGGFLVFDQQLVLSSWTYSWSHLELLLHKEYPPN